MTPLESRALKVTIIIMLWIIILWTMIVFFPWFILVLLALVLFIWLSVWIYYWVYEVLEDEEIINEPKKDKEVS